MIPEGASDQNLSTGTRTGDSNAPAAPRTGDGIFGVAEIVVAAVLFAFAAIAFASARPRAASPPGPAAWMLFTLLVGGYVALGIRAVPHAIGSLLRPRTHRILAGPGVLLVACLIYSAASGFTIAPRAVAFGAYLLLPAFLLPTESTPPGVPPARGLAAALLLWLPIEFGLVPPLPLPASGGYDVSRFVGLVAGLYLFLVSRPLGGIGYTYLLRLHDLVAAGVAFLAFAVVALPLGFATGFLTWHPQVSLASVVFVPLVIYLVTAVPEEFLFRGLFQNLLGRWLGPYPALAITAIAFGLAHLPDPRYALLAALAGVAYGWVYLRTGKITASAVTHTLVDAVWAALLGA